ncbi:hypothetical protein AVEN_82432-1 [Araneus ventricosus]|uniref:Uncharacterized protein n=1 Tax=Araneus ventricosus TaxID=182803 RepID=A0A4Y2GVJ1_ARAVE|nr:hypothetical protein AVEN_82432-1 [Araneus ventricosus]
MNPETYSPPPYIVYENVWASQPLITIASASVRHEATGLVRAELGTAAEWESQVGIGEEILPQTSAEAFNSTEARSKENLSVVIVAFRFPIFVLELVRYVLMLNYSCSCLAFFLSEYLVLAVLSYLCISGIMDTRN